MKLRKSVEILNESDKAVWAMACRTKLEPDKLYIHVARKRKEMHEGMARKVEPFNYAILKINEPEF